MYGLPRLWRRKFTSNSVSYTSETEAPCLTGAPPFESPCHTIYNTRTQERYLLVGLTKDTPRKLGIYIDRREVTVTLDARIIPQLLEILPKLQAQLHALTEK